MIEDARDLELTYNSRSQKVTARLYRVASGEKCLYDYHDVTYDPANPSSLKIPERDWKTDYLWSASESCKAEFIARTTLAKDRRSYDEEQIKRDILKLGQLSEKTSYEDLLRTLESCHIRSLKRQSYEWLIRTFKRIAQKETLKEREELAILRLMQSMDGKDYSRFYRDLEANQNALLRHLVSEIDDVSLYFWTDKDNYTNFIGALVWMFYADGGKSIKGRFPEALDDYARIVLNLTPVKYGSVQLMGGGDASFTEKYNQGEYISSTGEVKLLDVYKTYTTTRNSLHSQEHRQELGIVSPLTPIIIVPDTDNLPLIETALGGNALSDQMYVVPAIFMKYRADKIRNDNIAKGVVTAFDVATIVFSGGTALATKVHWIRRAWALAEVVGAVGNIAVNAQVITNPELKSAVDIYNTAMGVIGIKNAGQAGYKFVKNLPRQSKTLLQENKALRGLLASKYSEWKRIVSPKIKGLSPTEKQLLSQQEEVFKTLTPFEPERKPIKIAAGGEAVDPSIKAGSKEGLEQLKHRSREVVSNHPEFKTLNAGVQKEVLRQLDVAEEALQQELVTHPELVDEWLSIAAKDKKRQSIWIKQLLDGIRFNKERAPFYPFNEVYLESPKAGTRGAGKSSSKYKYVRLDSYNPRMGEIVSRKYTQLSEILEKTAIGYLKELSEKYSPGSVIADVPSNRVGANAGIFEENGGKTLRGQMILEVPVQEEPVPESVLRYAIENKIQIRDVKGKIYNLER